MWLTFTFGQIFRKWLIYYCTPLNIQISDGHYGDVDHHPDGVLYWAVLTVLQSSIGNDNDVGILSPIALKK